MSNRSERLRRRIARLRNDRRYIKDDWVSEMLHKALINIYNPDYAYNTEGYYTMAEERQIARVLGISRLDWHIAVHHGILKKKYYQKLLRYGGPNGDFLAAIDKARI